MRTLSAVLVVIAGFSQWGCGDDPKGPGVGPDLSWQLGCAVSGTGCGSSQDAHGPIGGRDPTIDEDNQKIEVTCTSNAAGLQITLEDPGRPLADPNDKTIGPRARSVLEITNASASANKCNVQLTEYSRAGARIVVNENCENSAGSKEGHCQLTGSKGSNGYAFDGTLSCPGMRENNAGEPIYKLGKARAISEPIALQIVSCD
ncbi:MAG: hypothetical protein JWN48_4504 [Myxococcaceae bacterium]|nr:hypothetical protein [Myxococcaceae bacterium]